MSELTRCNYCTLEDIKRRAKKDGEVVTTRPAKGGGVEVATHKPGEEPKEFGVWFMVLPDHCCC